MGVGHVSAIETLPFADGTHLTVRLDEPSPDASARDAAILYFHGFRSDQAGEKAEFFRTRATDDGFLFCSFDFRGHGVSGGELRGTHMTRNLEDAERAHDFLAARWKRPVILVGSSMGAATALWHATRRPHDVAAVLGIAPAVGMGRNLESWAGDEGLADWERTGTRTWTDDRGELELSWDVILDLRRYPPEELGDELGRIERPILMLQGQRDESVDWRGTVALAERAADAPVDLHLFTDGDHRLVDRKERMWSLMREFLVGRALG